MSLLVLGMSHRSTPIALLERVALSPEDSSRLAALVHNSGDVAEVAVVTTCNRLEVYAEAAVFHAAVRTIGAALGEVSGIAVDELRPHIYVHYDEAATRHAFEVACGLDSMALGEAQILGQIRHALDRGAGEGRVGPRLHSLLQQALRVGKRAHSETDLDRVSRSLVQLALARIDQDSPARADRSVLIVGAGAMAGLAAATVRREGTGALTVINRTAVRSQAMAARYDADWADWADLPEALAAADVVITCTGATEAVITPAIAEAATAGRETPQAYLDLALPRDVAPEVALLPGVRVVSLADLHEPDETVTLLASDHPAVDGVLVSHGEPTSLCCGDPVPGEPAAVTAVRDIVLGEVAAFQAARAAEEVAPLLLQLRQRASLVVDAELARLRRRLPEADETTSEEVAWALQRVVDKLLHGPTVNLKRLAATGETRDYAKVLSHLFEITEEGA